MDSKEGSERVWGRLRSVASPVTVFVGVFVYFRSATREDCGDRQAVPAMARSHRPLCRQGCRQSARRAALEMTLLGLCGWYLAMQAGAQGMSPSQGFTHMPTAGL